MRVAVTVVVPMTRSIDVVLAHDCPTNCHPPVLSYPSPFPAHSLRRANWHRWMRMDEALAITEPTWWIHGHYHCSYEQELHKPHDMKVVGLDCERRPDNFRIIEITSR